VTPARLARSVIDMAPRLILLCALLLVAGCGDEEESAAPPARDGTELVVRVDRDGPQGPKAAKEQRVSCGEGDASAACRAAGALKPQDLGPVPDDVACTDIFGGPETARISGTLDGERVDAEFARSNGCEIHRWDAVARLLAEVR
jgi:hypothetical protein